MATIRCFPALRKFLFLVMSLACYGSATCHADVRLPGFFGDHMVLQQDMNLRIWGWADSAESITVSLGGNSAQATADDDGRWRVELPPMDASHEPHVLKVSGKNTIELKDILIGEVWLCSGQSNMEWTVQRSKDASTEIAAANYPLIRHIKFGHRPSNVPLDDIESEWQICSSKTAAQFTAVGYFMARRLQKELNVPIGLINSSWGGTRVEPWTPPVGFKEVSALKEIHQSVLRRNPDRKEHRERLVKHVDELKVWLDSTAKQLESDDALKVAAHPNYPGELMPFKSHQDPTMLYNGMIHALVGFPIRGAIWYQGESNHVERMMYYEKKKALINGWRKLWGQNIPFYYVQIAPFRYGNEDPTILAEFWEAQAAVQEIPHTGMVVINDIATLNDIHPPNKQDVGARLALLALKNEYGRTELVASGPTFDSIKLDSDHLTVKIRKHRRRAEDTRR